MPRSASGEEAARNPVAGRWLPGGHQYAPGSRGMRGSLVSRRRAGRLLALLPPSVDVVPFFIVYYCRHIVPLFLDNHSVGLSVWMDGWMDGWMCVRHAFSQPSLDRFSHT